MRITRVRSVRGIVGAVAILVAISAEAGSRLTAATPTQEDARAIEAVAGNRLLAIGRLDRISRDNYTATILGQDFILLATASMAHFVSSAQVGDAVVVLGERVRGDYFVDAAIVLDGQYVQGVSRVYLLGEITSVRKHLAAFTVGRLEVDFSAMPRVDAALDLAAGPEIRLRGLQPAVLGVVTADSVEPRNDRRVSDVVDGRPDASMGTGKPDASMGTGKPDASLGTGSPDASMGTGKPDASMGTGKPDASMGTGKPDASLGTGKPDASLGTGKPDASLGTGKPDASMGTGKPDASLGTGKPDASMGTGKPDASLGTGKPDASLGTGKPDASMGTGKPDASLGTGKPDASMGTGKPDASLGTGKPDASMGTGKPDASLGTGKPDASMGTGKPDASLGTGSPDASLGTG